MTIATLVEQMVANSVVGRIPAGSAEPAAARRPITPVGSRVTLEVLMARNSTMALVAVPLTGLSRSSSCMARMPKGVAALPRPSTLAEMFMIIAPMAGCSGGTSGNIRVISGRTSRAMVTSRPAASPTFMTPKNSAMTPIRPMASSTALRAPSMTAVVRACIADGSPAGTTPNSSRPAATAKAVATRAKKMPFKLGAGRR